MENREIKLNFVIGREDGGKRERVPTGTGVDLVGQNGAEEDNTE